MTDLWRTRSLKLLPGGAGRPVDVQDSNGQTIATAAPDGTIRDASGALLLTAPLRRDGRRDRGTANAMEVTDAEGRALGAGHVVKYGLGPRARKATISIQNPQGAELARLEPKDKSGDELGLVADGVELATVAVTRVKAGFLRKTRVYAVELEAAVQDALRPLALAVLIRYDALLDAIAASAMRD